MSIQIASTDETILEELSGSVIYRDSARIIVLLDAKVLSEQQDAMLETDGLFVGVNLDESMKKTKSQHIKTTESCKELEVGQWIVEFEL